MRQTQVAILFLLFCLFAGSALTLFGCGKKSSSSSSDNTPQGGGGGGGGGSGGGGGGTGQNTVVMASYGRLFPTTATTDGSFAYNGAAGDMSLVADPLCAAEATNRSLTGVFKAVVALNGVRSTTSNWVLKPSTPYQRPDGTVIGTTNASGYFDFPLTHAISPTATTTWFGMTNTFDENSSGNCSNFTTNQTGFSYVGDLSQTSSAAINNTIDNCFNTDTLLCAEMISQTTTVPAQAAYRRIFSSSVAVVAATGITNENSVARFDQQCQTDANTMGISNGGYTSYKAFVYTNTTNTAITRRNSCLTANCANGPGEAVGWIMEPNMEYRRADGTTVIATTNANSIFDFPLTNSFTGVNENYWTGANTTWATATNASTFSCSFFQNNQSNGTANVGNGAAVDSDSISMTTDTCNNTNKILCIEQKRTQTVYVTYPGYN